MHHTHAAPAAAARRLDDHRVLDRPGDLDDFLRIVRKCARGARHSRDPRLDHGLLCAHLVAHEANRFGTRSDERETAFLDPFGKIGILGKEAVTGVDRLGVGHFGGADDGRHVEVTKWTRGWAYADRLVGQLDVLRLRIGFRISHYGSNAHFTTGALYAQRYFATVGDQDFAEHRLSLARISRGQKGLGRTRPAARSRP